MDELENYYLQRIAEIMAGAEKRVAHLTIEIKQLKIENAALALQVRPPPSTGEINELSDGQ